MLLENISHSRLMKNPQETESVVNFAWFYFNKLIVSRGIPQKE